jgi:hypothetical protein
MSREGYTELPYFSADKSELFKYAILADYDGILEPNAANNLALLDDDSSTDTGVYFLYTVCPSGSSGGSDCYTGSYSLSGDGPGTVSVTPACAPYDEFDLTVTAYDSSSGSELFSTEGSLLCLYVRREIRALTEDDLTKTMDAMYTMWATTDEDGQELYGANYQSAKFLLEYHFFNAAWQDAGECLLGLLVWILPLFYCLLLSSALFSAHPTHTCLPLSPHLFRPHSRGPGLPGAAREAVSHLRDGHAGRGPRRYAALLGLHH